MPIPLDPESIELFIQNIQNTTQETPTTITQEIPTTPQHINIQNKINKCKKHKHKHMDVKYIQFAKKNYHQLEKQIRDLFEQKLQLDRDVMTNYQLKNYKILKTINDKLESLKIDIERRVYMRQCILNEIRQVPGHDYFAIKKCKYFESNTGCHNGELCIYRH